MTLTPPLKWHGGKQYLASRIVALMPPHVHYVEPFAGGLAVLLAKDPEGVSEVVNDANRDLCNFWQVLQDDAMFDRFRRIVEAVPFGEEEWNQAVSHLNNWAKEIIEHCVAHAAEFFIACRQSLAGRMEFFAPLSRTRTCRGMNEQASAWLNAVEGLPAVHARLKRVVVLGPKDAKDVIRQQDGEQTVFYLDPPYVHATRAVKDVYAHEMSEESHRNLLTLIRQVKGKVMLSGYPSPMYDDLLKGWACHEFELPNNAAGGKEKRRMVECLWMNFQPQGGPA